MFSWSAARSTIPTRIKGYRDDHQREDDQDRLRDRGNKPQHEPDDDVDDGLPETRGDHADEPPPARDDTAVLTDHDRDDEVGGQEEDEPEEEGCDQDDRYKRNNQERRGSAGAGPPNPMSMKTNAATARIITAMRAISKRKSLAPLPSRSLKKRLMWISSVESISTKTNCIIAPISVQRRRSQYDGDDPQYDHRRDAREGPGRAGAKSLPSN